MNTENKCRDCKQPSPPRQRVCAGCLEKRKARAKHNSSRSVRKFHDSHKMVAFEVPLELHNSLAAESNKTGIPITRLFINAICEKLNLEKPQPKRRESYMELEME